MEMRLIDLSTDTATICIFDTTCLSHRKDDFGDWWSIPEDRLKDVRAGNVLFLDVGEDGFYRINVTAEDFVTPHAYAIAIRSGRLFIGPGEEASGGGFEPDGKWGGEFVSLDPGNYICKIRRSGNILDVFLSLGGNGQNDLTDVIRI